MPCSRWQSRFWTQENQAPSPRLCWRGSTLEVGGLFSQLLSLHLTFPPHPLGFLSTTCLANTLRTREFEYCTPCLKGAAEGLLPCAPSLGALSRNSKKPIPQPQSLLGHSRRCSPSLTHFCCHPVPGHLQPCLTRCNLLSRNPLRTWRTLFVMLPGLSSAHQLLGWQL